MKLSSPALKTENLVISISVLYMKKNYLTFVTSNSMSNPFFQVLKKIEGELNSKGILTEETYNSIVVDVELEQLGIDVPFIELEQC